jgi:hypothetical protein
VWELCVERERLLREVGFSDAYAHVKHNENRAALCLLPALLRVPLCLPLLSCSLTHPCTLTWIM